MRLLKQLWEDEGGAIVSAELVMAGTVLVIGMVTGMSSLRDAVITELADVGAAIGLLDQSYTVHGWTSHSSATASTFYLDRRDFCDDGTAKATERCLVICNSNGFAGALPPNENAGS